jgi:hypothetical protein
MTAPDTIEDLEALLEQGWEIEWDGRTGADYPPNYRLVELERRKDQPHEPYTPTKLLHLRARAFERVERELQGDEDDDEE